ncbi:hypothetical protein BCR32DRAFT_290853 [Anaeromyces robustus]|uniref:DH domain-containing protein n=1 Tax=Anaeromyces robustus TaxID=1754192 RepID=A0A1Y1XHE9_9FUNG|nr:hypothetical protein BCR32DRAFT_290853 [Anaeromyces robustus]|eukprot:ORX85188.1 hypothetical protein BCR32DRAFT_290853 [Anaeromyces robustus]
MGVQFAESDNADTTKYARVLYDFDAEEEVELSIKESDVVKIHELKGDWCYGELNGLQGWFPFNFITYIDEEEYNQLLKNKLDNNQPNKKDDDENNPLKALEKQIRSSTISGGSSHRISTDGKRSWYNAYQGSIRYKPKSASLLALKENNPSPEKNSIDKFGLRFSTAALDVPNHIDVFKTKSDSNILSSKSENRKSEGIEFVNGPAKLKMKWVDFVGGQSSVDSLGLTKNSVKRQEVIYEMIDTERDYVNDLSIIIELYIKPLRANNMLSKSDFQLLFSNVEQLYGVNQELLSLFEKRQKENPVVEEIGDIWLTMNEYLKMYMLYCGNYAYAITKLEDLKTSKSFSKFLNTQFHKKESRSLKLESFLIKPVQRICKYPLLLRELIKYTDETHKDYSNLIKAYARLETVVTVVNGASKEAEATHFLIAFQSRFTPKISIISPSRRLKYKCEVSTCMKKMSSPSQTLSSVLGSGHSFEKKKRLLFIFDDMILFAKPLSQGPDKMEKGKLKLIQKREYSNVEVRSIKNSSENNLINAIELTLSNPEILTVLFCETEEAKSEILSHLTTCIREYQSFNKNDGGVNIVKSLPSEKVYSMISNKNADPNEEEEEDDEEGGMTPTPAKLDNKENITIDTEHKKDISDRDDEATPKVLDDNGSDIDRNSHVRISDASTTLSNMVSCSSLESLAENCVPQDEPTDNDEVQNQNEFKEVIKMLDTFISNSNESLDRDEEENTYSHGKESSVIIKDDEDLPPSLSFRSPLVGNRDSFSLRFSPKKESLNKIEETESPKEAIKKPERISQVQSQVPGQEKRKSILNRISFYEKISLDSRDDNDDYDNKKASNINLSNDYPIKNAIVNDVLCKMKNARKYYVYEINVNLNSSSSKLIPSLKDNTSRSIKVYHTFEEFFDFHFQFIETTISNRDGKNNIAINQIPTLPSQIQCVNDRIARKRISGLQTYINGILNLLSSVQDRDIVYTFLATSGFDSLKLMEE